MVIAQGTINELQKLCESLTFHNRNLQAICDCSEFRRRRNNCSRLQPLSLPSTATVGTSKPNATTDPRIAQTASQKLHPIVCRSLRVKCECHVLQLCLNDLAPYHPPRNDPKGKATSGTQFWFLLSKCVNKDCDYGLPNTVPYLVFTCHPVDVTDTGGGDFNFSDAIYEEILNDDQVERQFYESEDGGETMRFTLQCASSINPGCPTVVSLDKLISDHSWQLKSPRYQLAAHLASSVLSFYASPWIRDWTLQTIQCVRQIASSLPTAWIPHVPVRFPIQTPIGNEARNTELGALGRILLQLGQNEPLCNPSGEDEELVIYRALIDLHANMGKTYCQVVRNCIQKWSANGFDLMQKDNLREFKQDLEALEWLVEEYTPRIPVRNYYSFTPVALFSTFNNADFIEQALGY